MSLCRYGIADAVSASTCLFKDRLIPGSGLISWIDIQEAGGNVSALLVYERLYTLKHFKRATWLHRKPK